MKPKDKSILCILVMCGISLAVLAGCAVSKPMASDEDHSYISGEGIITDKWIAIVEGDNFGSYSAFYFEIDDKFYIKVDIFDYYNCKVNDIYHFDNVRRNPDIN